MDERRQRSSDRIVAAVRDQLRVALATTGAPFACTWACLIHPRRRGSERGYGVITLCGESLALTVQMLRDLQNVPTLLNGQTPVMVGPADEGEKPDLDPDEPLVTERPVQRLRLWRVDRDGRLAAQTGALAEAGDVGVQFALLCAGRPSGWPP
ncbi:MAG: hypothetical protein ACOY71_02390 [Gemmatimonadota bacterium]